MDSKAGFHDLIAWQKADELASAAFRACRLLEPEGSWLRNQILRCAISVPANIAEGHGRGTQAELLRYLDVSRGSLSELEYYLHFLDNERLLSADQVRALDVKRKDAARVIFGLWRSFKDMPKGEWDHSGRIREEADTYNAN